MAELLRMEPCRLPKTLLWRWGPVDVRAGFFFGEKNKAERREEVLLCNI